MVDEDTLNKFMPEDEEFGMPRRSQVPAVSRIAIIEELSALTLVKSRAPKTVSLGDPSKPATIEINSDRSLSAEDVNFVIAKFTK